MTTALNFIIIKPMSTKCSQFSIKVAGPAGSGVKSTGHLLQRSLKRLCFSTLGYLGYPSLIRGGQNTYQVDLSRNKVLAPKSTTNILLALNFDALEKYAQTLASNSLVIIDETQVKDAHAETLSQLEKKYSFDIIELSVSQTLNENQLPPIVQNSFLVGAVFELLNYPTQPVIHLLKEMFERKGQVVVKANVQAVKLGTKAAQRFKKNLNPKLKAGVDLSPVCPTGKAKVETVVVTGNDTIAMGFIKAGGQFYSAYPMTPSSNILHFLEKHGKKHGLVVRQASNEIEAVGAAIGASYAGARSMVATSGGGLDLMSEFISMAATTETPIVVVNAQRTGSGTGLPTWTEQADLNMAKHTGHGEFPRVVIAPGTPLEAYKLTQEALNLADKYQIPVILLSDKYLSESVFTLTARKINHVNLPIDRGQLITTDTPEGYLRYKLTNNGVSPRTIPGVKGGLHVANSDDHDEYGNSIESDKMRVKMQTKRLKKLETLKKKLPLPQVLGSKQAKVALVGWGSTKGVLEAVAERLSTPTAVVHFTYLYPLDHERLTQVFEPFEKVVLVENNSTGQLKEDLILAGANLTQMILKFDGEPFFVDELLAEVEDVINNA